MTAETVSMPSHANPPTSGLPDGHVVADAVAAVPARACRRVRSVSTETTKRGISPLEGSVGMESPTMIGPAAPRQTSPSTWNCDEPDPVHVLTLEELGALRTGSSRARVVVDATATTPSLPWLARIVGLRRALRALGGDLVVAANRATVAEPRRCGLVKAIPWAADVPAAIAALNCVAPRFRSAR